MKERIQLLDVSVDILSTQEATDMTKQMIDEEKSSVVYLMNSQTLFLLKENSEWKTLVEESALILPATASVSASVDQVLGHKRDSFFLESYFDNILDYAIEMGDEILLVAEDENKFVSVQENIHEKRPYLTLSGVYLTENEESLDHIVNEINSVAPDILLLALEEQTQLELLSAFRTQINAGLLLVTGGILYNKAVSEADVPESIQKLRIDHIYKWFHMNGRIKAFWSNLKMNFQLKRHTKNENKTDRMG